MVSRADVSALKRHCARLRRDSASIEEWEALRVEINRHHQLLRQQSLMLQERVVGAQLSLDGGDAFWLEGELTQIALFVEEMLACA